MAEIFLSRKIQSLDLSYFTNVSGEKSLNAFFGLDSLKLKRIEGYDEKISKYILRHTMLMPRDIINIGNIYCEKKKYDSKDVGNEEILRRSVKHVAKNIADEQMNICAILISTKWIYSGVVESGNLNIYTDTDTINSIKYNLCTIVQKIGQDRFTDRDIKRILNNIEKYGFHVRENPFNALFLAGLLGYVQIDSEGNKSEIFFSESRISNYILPLYLKEFVFRSSLIDYLEIKAIGVPVYA
ncbi:hypothetical protein [Mucilaginibacter psychrotolerans]|uniref:Uncharacterized protein n=1 Tax=Mucilaginibacter psychrotolerans TaxID=1524096 RepID=A0A4Y8S4X6_9SPHI|nr:hypothetical protein [Mucilaginibacter psychrotolerans]TFF34013.1 hypothetical protein E2R66_23250 [Mucilaginibacter psychrotolerans]